MKYIITKQFADYPAAHRQPHHSGHCALIHGHNWGVRVEIGANALDGNGFVFDFGAFGPVKNFLTDLLDHTLLLQTDDPELGRIQDSLENFAQIRVLSSVSAEGLARHIYNWLFSWLDERRLLNFPVLLSVTVLEDTKNSATYYGPQNS